MPTFKIILSLLIIGLFSCADKPERPDPMLSPTYESTPVEGDNASGTNASTPEPAQNADGVWHYTCSNGCAGGGSSATACATCGSLLVHNTLYHNNPNSGSTPGATTITPSTPPTPASPSTPEPAQNAAGVWHYTCSNGCPGGGGSATACAGCGNLLVHNTTYHQ